jgi:hypothetical protein
MKWESSSIVDGQLNPSSCRHGHLRFLKAREKDIEIDTPIMKASNSSLFPLPYLHTKSQSQPQCPSQDPTMQQYTKIGARPPTDAMPFPSPIFPSVSTSAQPRPPPCQKGEVNSVAILATSLPCYPTQERACLCFFRSLFLSRPNSHSHYLFLSIPISLLRAGSANSAYILWVSSTIAKDSSQKCAHVHLEFTLLPCVSSPARLCHAISSQSSLISSFHLAHPPSHSPSLSSSSSCPSCNHT